MQQTSMRHVLRAWLPNAARACRFVHQPQPARAIPRSEFPHCADTVVLLMMANRPDFDRHLRTEDLLQVPPFPPGMSILEWHRHTELMHRADPGPRSAAQHCRDGRSGKAYKMICAQWAQQQPIAPGKAIGPELPATLASTEGLRHRDPIAAGNRH